MQFNVLYRRGNRPRVLNPFILLNLVIFIVAVLLYVVNENILKPVAGYIFFKNHFNDLLAMLLFLPYSNLLLSLYKKKDITLVSFWHTFVFSMLAGLSWEYVTPLYNTKSTSDPIDVGMYVAGGMIYWLLLYCFLTRKRVNSAK
ncbi:hypothetical protein [Aneurinibacillus aneurinilyticus]|uniref:VanZ-like domain-containing protein n=1 Tax=Aneurinibacillus aneurinilyticus TaxID=1391 RepID=A0A848CUG8_ANEAE|nr:hypothetical protein [Aneurinibacillus aneurinilyticus]NME98611.1 hypothetical protein [Aneurinibacillus aneurinilyticus]